MNEKSIQERSQDTIKLVNYAFSKLKIERLFDKTQVISKYSFENSMGKEIDLYLKDDLDVVMLKEENIDSLKYSIKINDVDLPLKENEEVGFLEIEDLDGNKTYYPLVVKEEVKKKSFIKIWINNILKWVS